jgi:hypothetical protein
MDPNPLKSKVMKLAYIYRKNGVQYQWTIIFSTLTIPLNKNNTKLKELNDEKFDNPIQIYNQLCLLVINEIF